MVYIGNLIGSLIFAAVDAKFFTEAPPGIGTKTAAIASAKVLPYMAAGAAGWGTAFLKGFLCNWMVSLGAVMALVTRPTIAKMFAMYLPIMAFVAQGFEYFVVNMFVIPCGILLDAHVSAAQW